MSKYKIVEDIIVKRKGYTRKTTNSGYRGVVMDDRAENVRYQSRFMVRDRNNYIDIKLGSYNTAEEAYIARLKFIDSLK